MTTISSSSAANAAYYANQKNLFGKLDSDQNGTLSSKEFVAGRPKGTSETQATELYAKIDVNSINALTEDQLREGMESERPYKKLEEMLSSEAMSALMLMSQQNGSFGAFGGNSASDLYAEMDADGDGSVSSAEFVAARPDDVSEENATALFESIDTENTGSITQEQFAAGMRPAGGPPPGGMGGAPASEDEESESETFDAMDTNKDGVVSADELLATLQSNMATFAQTSSTDDSLDKILELFGVDQ
jgi:Ca2+-binding EF-hand superfamily protein